MPKVAKALINFIDGSYLYAELSKKPAGNDSMLLCFRVIGMPENSPKDKPSLALNVQRTASASKDSETMIPMSRIHCITILEEYLGKDVPNDMQELWK